MSFSPQLYRRITAENPVIKPIPLLHTKREMWDNVDKSVRGKVLKWFYGWFCRWWCKWKNRGVGDKRVADSEMSKKVEGGEGGSGVVIEGWRG